MVNPTNLPTKTVALEVKCSYCSNVAVADAPSVSGVWAYMCGDCFEEEASDAAHLVGFRLVLP